MKKSANKTAWKWLVAAAVPMAMGQLCLPLAETIEELAAAVAGEEVISTFDGDWASAEHGFAMRIQSRTGTLTQANSEARKAGDTILVMTSVDGNRFTGRWVFMDASVHNVSGELTAPGTLAMAGAGWEWTMTRQSWTLAVSVLGQGAVSPSGGTFAAGESLTLTAEPADGWRFDHWEGDLSGGRYDHWRDSNAAKAYPGALTMDGDKSVTAVFMERNASTAVFELGGGVTLKVIEIPGGTFVMGSSQEEQARFSQPWQDYITYANESPQHTVTVSTFAMGETEVTQGQFRAVMGYVPQMPADCVKDCLNDQQGDNLPVVWLTWDEAVAFCDKLGELTERFCRMPTEAEWEYACRAGSTTPFTCGDDEACLDAYAWYNENSANWQESSEVGTKSPNAWGLYDMHGNVWEWVGDWSGDYPVEAQVDPTGPARRDITTPTKPGRGGAMNRHPNTLRSAYRYLVYRPGAPVFNFGFRVVCE